MRRSPTEIEIDQLMSSTILMTDLSRVLTPKATGVVAAAKAEFATHGFAGATTDAIARKAGVSQPYVVRLFGSKERLFLRCCAEGHEALISSFRAAIARTPERPVNPAVIGACYHDLVEDATVLKLMVQQNTMGDHPTIGPQVREWFMDLYRLLRREAGLPEEVARTFFARGMLINQLLSLGLTPEDEETKELLRYLAPTGERPAPGA